MLTALLHVAEIVGLTACWALAGYAALPARVRADEPFLVWCSAFALGAGATAVATTATAAMGVLSPATAWIIQALLVLAAGRGLVLVHRRGPLTFRVSLRGWPRRLGLAVLLLVGMATLLATLAPPSSMDAMVYHLRVPREFLRHHRWMAMPDIVQSFQPLYVEMLFGHGLGLADDVLAALIHWSLGLGAVACAGAWGRRLSGSALWAMLIFAATGIFSWESSGAFIDLGLACFASLAILWATRPDRGAASWVLAGLFGGLAAGSKLTGAFAAALAAGSALVAAAPAWRRGARRCLGVGAIALALALPWYLRNLTSTGNPFYPVGNTLLGLPPVALLPHFYGYGTDVLHLLRSPFELLWRGGAFDQGWSVGPAFLALVPLGMAVTFRRPVGRTASVALLLWWLFWFASSQQTRLLLPVAPIAAGLGAVGARWALASPSRLFRWATGFTLGTAATVGLVVALLTAQASARVATGAQSPADYLRRNSWHYVAFEQANRLLPADARVAVVGPRAKNLYYLDRPATHFDRQPSGVTLGARQFTHVLNIDACPLPTVAPVHALWSGQYPILKSRVRGGVDDVVCARLSAVADAAVASR